MKKGGSFDMHGNSSDNPALHHLYDIFKKSDRDTFKYGISAGPIEDDGYSSRVRDQLEEMNLAAEYDKFDAEILLINIPGRLEALRLEREYIDAYFEQHGRNPPGNKLPKR
jgi:URI fold toxin 2